MTPDQFDTLLDCITSGETLKTAIATAKTSWRSLSLLIERDPSAASRYVRARSDSATFYADKAQEAAESARTSDEAQIARIKADVYKWRAAKANPREYGERTQLDIDATVSAVQLTAGEREERVKALLMKAGVKGLLKP